MKIKLGLGQLDMESVARYCAGELYDYTGDKGCKVSYVCTDSREADADTLFVATRGERVDGHDYIVGALDRGCRCVLCEYVPTNIAGREVAFVTVENSIEAFALIARGYRENKRLRTVALTGSVGKTTTKELTASILQRETNLYATSGNFNSVIGMPMSLMEAPADRDTAVFEMGMSGFGEIRSMTRAAAPDIAMVVNIGSSHLEYLKTRENIARAKLEIAEGLREGGHLLLNGDEPLLRKSFKGKKFTVTYVGIENKSACDVYAENVKVSESGTEFDLVFKGKTYEKLKIKLIGKQFVYNAAFAAASALLLGCSEETVREGLYSYTPDGIRQNIYEKNGVTVIADCYNAAPESMRGAIDTLRSLSVDGKRIAVLGDMRELGADSDKMHREMGEYVARQGVDVLLTIGESGALIAEGAILGGMPAKNVFAEKSVDNIDSLCSELDGRMKSGDALLFKASRGVELERAIKKLFDN
ncbi:MAG: UDP-N-acetylmuramoyl-tripeptide--D-alanyl-D-alanine ligase [Ruminococcaceae bacterium]|nr:UDP-N-acetylmuramoyl-tripeptide--D-alanyl-D-alanine ligase [Oscillospiraceae bacterium]